jgi:hypothetical protein
MLLELAIAKALFRKHKRKQFLMDKKLEKSYKKALAAASKNGHSKRPSKALGISKAELKRALRHAHCYTDGGNKVMVITGQPKDSVKIGIGPSWEEAIESLESTPIQSTGRDSGLSSALKWAEYSGWFDISDLEKVDSPEDNIDNDYQPSLSKALHWARNAEDGDYLVDWDETGMSDQDDPGSRAGYDDDELDQIRNALEKNDLTLEADDVGLRATSIKKTYYRR